MEQQNSWSAFATGFPVEDVEAINLDGPIEDLRGRVRLACRRRQGCEGNKRGEGKCDKGVLQGFHRSVSKLNGLRNVFEKSD